MPLDPSIILSQKPLEPLEDIQRKRKKADLDLATGQQRQQMNELQIANQKIANLSQRERARLESSILGLARTKSFLDAGDTQGAENYLLSRRQELGRRIAAGEDVDIRETDQALQMFRNDPEAFKRLADAGVNLGFQSGILRDRNANIGMDVQFANELADARARGDTQRVNDLLLSRKIQKLDTGQTIDPNTGQVMTLSGFSESASGIAADKERSTLNVQREIKPQIVKSEEEAKKDVQIQAEAKKKLTTITTEVDNLVEDIDDLADDPALDSIVGAVDGRTLDLRGGSRRAANLLNKINSQSVLKAADSMQGTLSDSDIDLLKQSANDLQRTLNEDDFRANLKKFRRRALRMLKDSKDVAAGKEIKSRFLDEGGKSQESSPTVESLLDQYAPQ